MLVSRLLFHIINNTVQKVESSIVGHAKFTFFKKSLMSTFLI